MTILKRHTEGLVTSTSVDLPAIGLGQNQVGAFSGAKFGRLVGIRARNFSSSAKSGAGADVLISLRITDGNGDIVYLDAADADFATAERTVWPTADDTVTGITAATGGIGVDQTGAAASAGAGAGIIMQSPVTVRVLNGATATDYFSVDLLVEV
jgi:hypothetical protein